MDGEFEFICSGAHNIQVKIVVCEFPVLVRACNMGPFPLLNIKTPSKITQRATGLRPEGAAAEPNEIRNFFCVYCRFECIN